MSGIAGVNGRVGGVGAGGGVGEVERDALYSMYQLPATWTLLRLLSVPGARGKLPDMADMALALRAPERYEDVVSLLHTRVLGLHTGSEWLMRLSVLVWKRREHYQCVFGDDLMKHDAVHSNGNADVATSASESEEPHYAGLRTTTAYNSLSAEQRLLLLQTTAELVVCDSKVHDVGNSRVRALGADEARLGCYGTDSNGNDYYYFGDRQHLFREPGREPRMRTLPHSFNAADEEKRRKERERVKRQEELERRKEVRERLEAEKRARMEERKRAAEAKKAEKAERARKREAEKARRIRQERLKQMAGRDPNARRTRGLAETEVALASDDNHANCDEDTVVTGEASNSGSGECSPAGGVDLGASAGAGASAGTRNGEGAGADGAGDDPGVLGNTNATEMKLKGKAKMNTKSVKSVADWGAGDANALKRHLMSEDVKSIGATVKRARKLEDELMPLVRDEPPVDPTLRQCSGWELVAATHAELEAFLVRFGDAARIKDNDERLLVRRMRDELIHEFADEERAALKRREKRLKREKFAKMPVKKSSRLQAVAEKREEEEMEKMKMKRRRSSQRLRK